MAKKRKQELAEKVIETPAELLTEAELSLEPQNKNSWKEISSGPIIPDCTEL